MIMVTGGAGFIGSVLQAALAQRGHDTVVVDWLGSGGKWRNLAAHPPARIVPPEGLDAYLATEPPIEAIFHLGAISALAGLREEAEAVVRARIDEAVRRLDLVKREELEAVSEMAANARAGQEAAELKLQVVLERLDALEARLAAAPPAQMGDDAGA
jgi:ADP-L-glycero-D-manno-heptose 6-epimerase